MKMPSTAIPPTALIQPNQQLLAGWKEEVGSGIGTVNPTKYGLINASSGTAIVLSTTGAAWANWLAAPPPQPILPNTGNFAISYKIMVDELAASCAQAVETDSLIIPPGFKGNLSLQINYAEKGMLQIANASGGWVDTGNVVGLLPELVQNEVVIVYSFNAAEKKCSVVSYQLNGTVWQIPVALQNVAMEASTWTSGVYLQVQQDLAGEGGSWAMAIDEVTRYWW